MVTAVHLLAHQGGNAEQHLSAAWGEASRGRTLKATRASMCRDSQSSP